MSDKKKEDIQEEEWPRDFEDIAVCCQTGCPDCPWGFNEQFDPDVPMELQIGKSDSPEDEND